MPEQRYAIWGSAGHAKVLASLVRAIGGEVVATFDNDPAAQPLAGVPLFIGERGFATWAEAVPDHGAICGLVAKPRSPMKSGTPASGCAAGSLSNVAPIRELLGA